MLLPHTQHDKNVLLLYTAVLQRAFCMVPTNMCVGCNVMLGNVTPRTAAVSLHFPGMTQATFLSEWG